jgi:hypothetical protein
VPRALPDDTSKDDQETKLTDKETQPDQQMERLRDAVDRKSEQARAQAEEESLIGTDRQQDQLSVRAKNSGHGKKTADKWNQ